MVIAYQSGRLQRVNDEDLTHAQLVALLREAFYAVKAGRCANCDAPVSSEPLAVICNAQDCDRADGQVEAGIMLALVAAAVRRERAGR